MGIKAIMMKYGLYIPLVCVLAFFLWGLQTDGTEDWINQTDSGDV